LLLVLFCPEEGGRGSLLTSSTCWTGTTNQLFKEQITLMHSDSCKEKQHRMQKIIFCDGKADS
jgi:hypothetical protein